MTEDTTNPTDASLSECGHERFERNHYFHGKLMTARDMAAEQAYHVGQRRAHARSVVGSGVAWGLKPTVEDDGDALLVTVEKGYAIDECGRPVVVPEERETTVPRSDIDFGGTSAVTISLAYEACLKESVPVAGAESACEDECAYNRVLEVFEIEVTGGTPSEMAKPVPMVEFPDRDQLDTVDDREAPEPTDDGLATIASSYREAAGHETADPETTEVFVGAFEEEEGTWSRIDEFPTSVVYTNDMLYAAIARHATDFGNPHDVLTSVDGVQHVDGNVELVSDDGTIDSGRSESGGAAAVSVELADAVKSEIEDLAEYVRDKTLKYTIEAFYDVAATYAGVDSDLATEINAIAVEIIRRARDALDDEDFEDEHEFAVAIRDIAAHQKEIERRLADSRDDNDRTDLATDRSYEDFERAVGALEELLPSDPDGTIAGSVPDGYVGENSVTALAVSQDQLCEAATWLETSTHGRMTLPGGHEVESRIIEDVIDPRVVEPTGLRPGDPVVDREAETSQTAIVLREAEETADEWIVYQDETVAHQNRMYDYADDEPVVLVAYEEILDENWEYWRAADPRDLFHGVLSRGIKFHAFPEARLRRVEE